MRSAERLVLVRLCRTAGKRPRNLMPGNEDEAAGLLDAYLEQANTKARLAQVEA